MITLKIDDKEYRVPDGITVMAAVRMQGIDVPSMCYREGKPHFSSCMICMVKDRKSGTLFPSCSLEVTSGMDIVSNDEEVIESRRMALELLLSEHVGDCEAPCTITCPAHMNIPLMNRLLGEGRNSEALDVVRRNITLPTVFGYVCPAPCEGACHRKTIDSPVSICLLKRYAGEQIVAADYSPKQLPDRLSGKRTAVVGAGVAGLAAAYYLRLAGHEVIVFDQRSHPGGELWEEIEQGRLPAHVLEQDLAVYRELGVVFKQETTIDKGEYEKLCAEFDAVLVATGTSAENTRTLFAVEEGTVKKNTYRVADSNVFVTGSALKKSRLAIRAHGQGREAAESMNGFLRGEKEHGIHNRFNSRFGKLRNEEVAEYLKDAIKTERNEPDGALAGLSKTEVLNEAARCMHCDCRKLDNCELRDLSDAYGAKQKHFWSADRKSIRRQVQHETIVYEPSKCIKCGKCVEITRENKEKYGMSFIGRGFDMEVGVPFNESIKDGLSEVGREVASACPTGALSMK